MRNKATKKNMDLDLRRYGNNLYSKAEQSGGSGGGESSVDFNTILDNISIKDDLLTKLQAIDYTNQGEDGVLTDLTFDDVFNDYNDSIKSLLYIEKLPAILKIMFPPNATLEVTDYGLINLTIQVNMSLFYTLYIEGRDNDIEIYAIKFMLGLEDLNFVPE